METNNKEILAFINKYLTILTNNFRYLRETKGYKPIPDNEINEMINQLGQLINQYHKNVFSSEIFDDEGKLKWECKNIVNIIIIKYIPLLDVLIKIAKEPEYLIDYESKLKDAHRMAARISFEHYMIFREWDDHDKFFAPRYEIMQGYIHYLQELELNPEFEMIVFNAPSGYGKTYPEKISEAWSYGINDTGTILALCSNEDVVCGGSRTVINEIKSEHFGEVFTQLKYNENDRNFFLKETESNWKLKNCRLPSSYIAKTINSNVVGSRASKRIHLDDLYQDYKEAMNQGLNEHYYNDYELVWKSRFVQNKKPKIVITGTLWSSGDFIDRVITKLSNDYEFKKHSKYPYTWVNEEGTVAIIKVPALNKSGISTVPDLITTKDVLKKKNSIAEYLWETNYQQTPTNPEALIFSYDKIRTYESISKTECVGTYAVIDATRKSGKDFFSMPVYVKVPFDEINYDYYLKDCIFTKKATKDLYEEILAKIIEHNIVKLVIESNVAAELKKNLDDRLLSKGIVTCEIIDKYAVENKSVRITDKSYQIHQRLVHPQKGMFGINSDMGKFMDNLTMYNSTMTNANDDAPDSEAMFCSEIIEGGSLPQIAVPMQRLF